ncbi:MAG: hypothetical protein ACR2FI_07290 [Burkholderiales bacterium]|nr:hypothetical protein [Pseudomonadota bacterium]
MPDRKQRARRTLAVAGQYRFVPRILERLLSEREFLSKHGIRSVSRIHAERCDLGTLPGIARR